MKKYFVFIVMLASMLASQLVNAQSLTITTTPSPATICSGSGTLVSLVANTSGTVHSRSWSDGVNVIGTGASINVSPATTTIYTVTVEFGVMPPYTVLTQSATVTVQPAPAQATISAGGPTTICTGGNVVLTSSAATNWQWYQNGNPIIGETNQNYTATTSGDYTVTGTSGVCNIPMSAITTVTVVPLPVANVTPAGPLTACYGTTVTLTADPVAGATYQWWYSPDGISGNWSIVTGETGQTYNAGTTGRNGVQVTIGGCTNRSFVP